MINYNIDIYLRHTEMEHMYVRELIELVSNDRNGNIFNFTIFDKEQIPYDLTGKTVTLIVKSEAGTVIEDNCTIVNQLSGNAKIIVPSDMFCENGTYYAEIQIWEGLNRITSLPFDYTVRLSLDSDEAVKADNRFSLLQQALNDVNNSNAIAVQAKTTAESALDTANQATTTIAGEVAKIDKAVLDANAALDRATNVVTQTDLTAKASELEASATAKVNNKIGINSVFDPTIFNFISAGDNIISVEINGLSYKIQNTRDNLIKIKTIAPSGRFNEDVYITTKFNNEYDLIQCFRVFMGPSYNETSMRYNDNGCVNIFKSYIKHKVDGTEIPISNTTDDACPLLINNEYIGGNHGALSFEVTGGFNKTFEDIGSKWIDSNGKVWWLIMILGNGMLFVPNATRDLVNDDLYTYDATSLNGTLTHVDGATHIENIDTSRMTITKTQLRPALKNQYKYMLIDGVKYTADMPQFDIGTINDVSIIDSCDYLCPVSVRERIVNGKPIGGYKANPTIQEGEVLFNMTYIYTINPNGNTIINGKITAKKNFKLTSWGITQKAKVELGDTTFKYIPNTKIINGMVGNTGIDLKTNTATGDYTKEYWEFQNYPPQSECDVIGFNTGLKIGHSIGYISRDTRVNSVAWTIGSNCKSYPKYLDGYAIDTVIKNTSINGISYRNIFCINSNNKAEYADMFEYDGKTYIRANYTTKTTSIIEIPSNMWGKSIKVNTKTENIDINGDIATDKLEMTIKEITEERPNAYIEIVIG